MMNPSMFRVLLMMAVAYGASGTLYLLFSGKLSIIVVVILSAALALITDKAVGDFLDFLNRRRRR